LAAGDETIISRNVAVRLVSCYRYARLTLRAPFLLIVVSSPAAKE